MTSLKQSKDDPASALFLHSNESKWSRIREKKFGNFEMRGFIQFCWRWNNQYPTRPLFDGRVPLASATPAILVEGISRVSILIAARPVFFLTSSNFWCSNKKTLHLCV
jgi:hypothetical protein